MTLAFFERHARPLVVEALSDTRVVFVMGARQVGTSTLTTSIAERDHPAWVLTLDNDATRAAASADPAGFVAGFDGPVVIDEVQRVPDLLLAISHLEIDSEPAAGTTMPLKAILTRTWLRR
jgi:predicted AAA+ superfamily ATPase